MYTRRAVTRRIHSLHKLPATASTFPPRPPAAYSAQWSGPAPRAPPQPGPLLVSASQPLGPYPPTAPGHTPQGFHPAAPLQKSLSTPGGPNLRTT